MGGGKLGAREGDREEGKERERKRKGRQIRVANV